MIGLSSRRVNEIENSYAVLMEKASAVMRHELERVEYDEVEDENNETTVMSGEKESDDNAQESDSSGKGEDVSEIEDTDGEDNDDKTLDAAGKDERTVCQTRSLGELLGVAHDEYPFASVAWVASYITLEVSSRSICSMWCALSILMTCTVLAGKPATKQSCLLANCICYLQNGVVHCTWPILAMAESRRLINFAR